MDDQNLPAFGPVNTGAGTRPPGIVTAAMGPAGALRSQLGKADKLAD